MDVLIIQPPAICHLIAATHNRVLVDVEVLLLNATHGNRDDTTLIVNSSLRIHPDKASASAEAFH